LGEDQEPVASGDEPGDGFQEPSIDMLQRILVAMTVLGTLAAGVNAAASQSIDELLRRQKEQQEKRTDQVVNVTKPFAECVKKQAHTYELYSSPEKADVAARAAVGRCSKQEAAYSSALHQLKAVMTGFDADGMEQRMHDQMVETALTIIVSERQRQRAQPQATDETETQHFKHGCSDVVAGRMSQDALMCVSVLRTAMELVVIFQGRSGTKEMNICIPHDPAHPPLLKDYVKLIDQYPTLMDDKEPVSVGLLIILERAFPCAK
jgi:hypothetical protein